MSSMRRAHEVPFSDSRSALTAPTFFDLQDECKAERWERYLELKPKVDHELQDFINAIRTARLETHRVSITADSSGEFSADEATNRAMGDKQRDILRHFQVPLEPCQAGEYVDEQEVPHKDTAEGGSFVMDMVLLPCLIPGESDIPCADTLFITRDDLALFSLIRSLRKVVLLGNPGIGKSWFQYLYLLFVVRPDVYSSVSKEPHFPSSHQHSNQPPEVIVRLTRGGGIAHVYFFEEHHIIVHRIKSSEDVCELMNAKNTLMMFEPGRSKEAVPYEGLDKMQILATVSPDEARYKEFVKNGGIRCFKPCPSTRVLLATGALMRSLVDSDLRQAYSSSKIKERIRSMGPFQRYVLPSNGSVVQDALARRKSSLARLSTEDLSKLALHYVLMRDDIAEVSHWFCRYEVDRELERPYLAGSAYNVATSSEFISHVNHTFASVQLVDKVRILMNLEAAPQKADDLPLARVWFEDVFVAHASSKGGLRWNAMSQTRIFNHAPHEEPDGSFSCVPLQLKFNKVIRGKAEKWHQLQKGILFFRIDPSFPFVGVWKEGDEIFAFQATTSSKHPKSLETFRSFLVKLGFDVASPLPVTINIVYVVLPRVLNKLFSNNLKLPPSFFWLSKRNNEKDMKNLTKRVKFWITSPPYDFSAIADGANLDEIVDSMQG